MKGVKRGKREEGKLLSFPYIACFLLIFCFLYFLSLLPLGTMNRMKRLLRTLPVETYVLLLPALAFIGTTQTYRIVCAITRNSLCDPESPLRHNLLFQSMNTMILTIIALLGLYVLCAIVLTARGRLSNIRKHFLQYGRSFLFVFGTLYLAILAHGLAIRLLFLSADRTRTVALSHMMMNADRTIFGFSPPFALNDLVQSQTLSTWIVQSYLQLLIIAGCTTLVLLFRNTILFRKYLLAYFIAFIISYPFWYVFPVLHPDYMYRANVLQVEIPEDIKHIVQTTHFLPSMTKQFDELAKIWVDSENRFLPISNFPSMHAALGIITAAVLIEMWFPLAIIVIPWLVLMLTGTMLLLQHYAVDVMLGIVISSVALQCAMTLLALEQRYFIDRYNILAAPALFSSHFQKSWQWVKREILALFAPL